MGRRIVSLVALASYLVVCLGIPLPRAAHAAPTDSASGTPYPCQAHRCGCRSAEQCWTACCCMTDREKLLWAERHGVVPPASVMSRVVAEPASGGCCSKSSRSPKKLAAPAPHADCATCTAPDAAPAESRVQWVSYLAAQRCSGGATTDWVNGPIGLPLTAPLHCLSLPVPVQAFVRMADPLWNSAFFTPPHRPPRIV